MKWITESIDKAKLVELHKQGLNDVEIAKVLGCSKEGVRHARVRLGLESNVRRALREKDAAWMEIYRQGLSDAEMAAQLGVSVMSVVKWRLRQGLPPNKSKRKSCSISKPRSSHRKTDSFVELEAERLRALLAAAEEHRKQREEKERAFRAMYRVYADGTVENHLFPWMDTYTPRAENERAQ